MDDLMTDLVSFEEPWPDDDETGDVPTLAGTEQANRMLDRLRLLGRDAGDVRALAAAERERIDAWEADRLSGIGREVERAEKALEQFMRAHHAAGGGVTLNLPSGELKLRANKLRLVVTDDAEAVAWCEEHAPDAINRPEPPAPKPDKNALHKLVGDEKPLAAVETTARTDEGEIVFNLVAEGGVVVPGVVAVRDADERKFSVSPIGGS